MGWSVVVVDIQLSIQSVHITINIVSLNPAHDELYSIQHDMIKLFSDLRQVSGFLQVLRFPPQIKLTFTILPSLFIFRSLHVEYST